jgi:DNA-binding NarL/FixJ family response regulator
MAARLLAAADAYQAMLQPRRWRAPFDRAGAADQLRAMSRSGHLDAEATRAVLDSSGHKVARRGAWPAGLSNREVEVVRLVVRGHSNREVARRLVVSERTVAHHLEHAYTKMGVVGRGAAALWAIRNGLLEPDTDPG